MTIKPILAEDIEAVGRFLHENLNRRISAEAWSSSLRQPWATSPPNHGVQLFSSEGMRVGVLLALYSEQLINGRTERFCNPHSWCVLDSHRHASLSLVLAILRQRDYHFTMFTPNPKVTQVFAGLRFRPLDDGLLHFPNLARPWRGSDEFVDIDAERIAARLRGAALAEFQAHRHLPWLRFVAFGRGQEAVLAIYKPGHWKRMPCAMLAHFSDPALAARHGHLLRSHLMLRGFPVSRVEARFLPKPPSLTLRTLRTQPKLVLVRAPAEGQGHIVSDGQIRDVYSELMALDI